MMPFTGGVLGTANGTLILSLAAAILYGVIATAKPNPLRMVVKAGSVALLAVLAAVQGGPLLLVAALALSAMGDAFLAWDGEKPFLAGLASFLAAHALYISLFAWSGGGEAQFLSDSWRAAVAIVMALGVICTMALLWPRLAPGLRLPVFVYASAIFLMGLAALTMNNAWVIAGAILFMISDTILAVDKFLLSSISPQREWTPYAVWLLYYAGQLLITMGFLIAV